jgi:hypothetical protein
MQFLWGWPSAGKAKSLLTEDTHNAEGSAHTTKRLEQQAEGSLHLLVWIEHDATRVIIRQAQRQAHPQLSSLGLVE